MKHETDNKYIQQLISEADEIVHQQPDPDQLPRFDQVATTFRQQNRISDEIKVLELAVQFYENPDLEYEQRIPTLNKFKARLNARQKEVKVLEVLGWE